MANDNAAFQKSVDQATYKIINQLMGNVEKAVLILESESKKECPVDQGILRASITHDVSLSTKEIVGSCYTPEEIGPYVHQGTGIYAVDGNGRKTPWNWANPGSKKWSGRKGYRGSRPNPFMERARNKSMQRIEKILGGKEK